ncbi:hypothetical protein StoSoilB13_18900 [Arthrobacter sp. StoSoilB13]|nr:hypothetical protein StoSoilB13_18900 [Arthrobacter sp. StoSoilB13]
MQKPWQPSCAKGLGEDVPVQPLDLFKYVFSKPTPQLKEQSELLADELARAESAEHGTESAK